MLRPDISRLKKHRARNLQIGFVITLSFVIMAFNWTVYKVPEPPIEVVYVEEEDITITPVTYQNPPKPPPPVLEPSPEIIPDDPEFIEEPLPEKVDEVIDIPKDKKVVKIPPRPKAINQPAPPPPMPDLPKEPEIEAPVLFVEEMPRFPGCEEQGLSKDEKRACAEKTLMAFIYKNIKYPVMARETNTEGTVVASFIVEKDGRITDLEIVRDIGAGCGSEVMRIVKKMPDWIPGKRKRTRTLRPCCIPG
ncbi:MAG: energy transducer TonB, partial [Bacteroidota bacterium]